MAKKHLVDLPALIVGECMEIKTMEEKKVNKYKTRTVVKGIRANQDFFDMCDFFAKRDGETRNDFILGCVGNYVEEYLDYDDWLKHKKEKDDVKTER